MDQDAICQESSKALYNMLLQILINDGNWKKIFEDGLFELGSNLDNWIQHRFSTGSYYRNKTFLKIVVMFFDA